jgi:preprotein translocase subunit SecA
LLLQTLDTAWREHLAAMDYLRQGIHLRGYAQKNPKQEYKRESFELFGQMLDKINYQVASGIAQLQLDNTQHVEAMEAAHRQAFPVTNMHFGHQMPVGAEANANATAAAEQGSGGGRGGGSVTLLERPAASPKLGRNEPCFCGSGKKYKQCHGQLN